MNPMLWNRQSLMDLLDDRLQGRHLVVVSNREPYVHDYHGARIECARPASGLVTALDAMMQASRGTWIAYGSGTADKDVADNQGRVRVPTRDNGYWLQRVWLTRQQERQYYHGFSNQTLWPLCLNTYQRPSFQHSDWRSYQEVNEIFAQAVLREIEDRKAMVLFQDYHLALAPRLVKVQRPDALLAHFWHIPWPNADIFRICPWRRDLLQGLLGNDVIGFHIRYHCDNFLGCVDRELEACIDREHSRVVYSGTLEGNATLVRPFPIGVDFDAIGEDVETDEVREYAAQLAHDLGLKGRLLVLGVDRIDHAKGIPERLRAIDHFLEQNPSYIGRVVFVEIGVISRIQVDAYQHLNSVVTDMVTDLNYKYGTSNWVPVHMVKKYHTYHQLLSLYRMADVLVVSSLHDGMNLVAKEFVAARTDLGGALVLSQFTGAMRELAGAFPVNPFDIEEMASAILSALEATAEDKARRMLQMQTAVRENNIYRWAGKLLGTLCRVEDLA